ncbi:MAG: type II toxin-antitoxin system HipA family toxin, partial [Vulcanimicrobiaceae bacterium]
AHASLAILQGAPSDVLAELEQLGGSSGGARPKVLVGMNHAGDIISGAGDLPEGFEAWIVKFRSSHDVDDIGPLEAAYASMARAAGLEMAETALLPSLVGPGHFATKRFDRQPGGSRLHVASVAGLLESAWEVPSVDYDTLLKVTMAVTRQHRDVEKMFHRMVFNIVAHNRDDHAKQHAFLMDAHGKWRLAPAYDLTYSRGPGGEHYLAVRGKGSNISQRDIVALGKSHGISTERINDIVAMTVQAVGEFDRYARDYGAGALTVGVIKKDLDAQLTALRRG